MGETTTYVYQEQLRNYCKRHGHDWIPVSTEGASIGMVKCAVCGAYQYRL